MPKCTYVQCYDPAVHVLRRGLNKMSVMSWLLLGGIKSTTSDMSQIRKLDNVGIQFLNSVRMYLKNVVCGSAIRFEAVISGVHAAEVMPLIPTYGSRIAELCLDNGLLSVSSKNWPYYIDSRITSQLRRLEVALHKTENLRSFNRSVSISCFKLCFCWCCDVGYKCFMGTN